MSNKRDRLEGFSNKREKEIKLKKSGADCEGKKYKEMKSRGKRSDKIT